MKHLLFHIMSKRLSSL